MKTTSIRVSSAQISSLRRCVEQPASGATDDFLAHHAVQQDCFIVRGGLERCCVSITLHCLPHLLYLIHSLRRLVARFARHVIVHCSH